MNRIQDRSAEGHETSFVLKTHDIAVLLDVSPDEVNKMARRGVIKGHKIGKQWRFRTKDVNRFLDRLRSQMMALD